jgi:DnaK suppressor protein
MSDSDLDIARLRGKLLAQREALLSTQATRQEAGQAVELDQTRTGRLSRMDALQGQAMAKAAQQRAERQIMRIDAALRRIEEGSYGDCARCEEPIDPRRLDADPATPLCVVCADQR